MALWKEAPGASKEPAMPAVADGVPKNEPAPAPDAAPPTPPRHLSPRDARDTVSSKESIIAADITITGKIDGRGHVRLAGKFEGDVTIEGNLTVDPGAKLTGSVRAKSVTISGEIEGNIDSADSVELQSGGVLTGDLKAGTLTVASGSRMRGRVEFGWGNEASAAPALTLGARHTS